MNSDVTISMPAMRRAEPVTVGVIGLGRAGCWHIEWLGLSGDFSIVAACDDCPSVARRAAGLVPGIATSYRAIFDDPQIDLVVIATPPATHAGLAIEALSAGKHVLLETPCALNSFEARALLEAERRSTRSVIVANQRRWDADFRLAHDCLASGEIGEPIRIKFVHWQYGPAIESRNAQGDDHPVGGGHWRDYAASGGGALWEFGAHRFDQLLLLARDKPVSVYARMDHAGRESVDTGFLALIQFASGLEAHIEINRGIAAPLETGWVVAAHRGSYVSETRFTVTDEGEIVDVPLAARPLPDDFHSAVARYLKGDGPNPVPLVDALQTIELIDAVRSSARASMPVILGSSGG